jgi:hypothetical protein
MERKVLFLAQLKSSGWGSVLSPERGNFHDSLSWYLIQCDAHFRRSRLRRRARVNLI